MQIYFNSDFAFWDKFYLETNGFLKSKVLSMAGNIFEILGTGIKFLSKFLDCL